jgi:hypothetical protein
MRAGSIIVDLELKVDADFEGDVAKMVQVQIPLSPLSTPHSFLPHV